MPGEHDDGSDDAPTAAPSDEHEHEAGEDDACPVCGETAQHVVRAERREGEDGEEYLEATEDGRKLKSAASVHTVMAGSHAFLYVHTEETSAPHLHG